MLFCIVLMVVYICTLCNINIDVRHYENKTIKKYIYIYLYIYVLWINPTSIGCHPIFKCNIRCTEDTIPFLLYVYNIHSKCKYICMCTSVLFYNKNFQNQTKEDIQKNNEWSDTVVTKNTETSAYEIYVDVVFHWQSYYFCGILNDKNKCIH